MPANQITQYATFTGNPAIETLLDEQFGHFLENGNDLISAMNIRKPDGTVPPDDWAPAIFLPAAGLHGFNVLCYVSEILENLPAYIYEEYYIPRTTKHALSTLLVGTPSDIQGFCQQLCNLSGMCCAIIDEDCEDDEEPCHGVIRLQPRCAPVSDFASLLVDDPET